MPHRGTNYFHLHLVSDATGETLITVARAAAAQYASVSPVEHMHPLVRSHKQLDRVLAEIENSPGIVLYTLLEKELATRLEDACRNLGEQTDVDSVVRSWIGFCHAQLSSSGAIRSNRPKSSRRHRTGRR